MDRPPASPLSTSPSTLRRVAPALTLLVLSPLVSEYLLGDFSIRQLGILVGLLPLYGGGALLVREITRRGGRGWPTMILLALAYALIEEGLLTQSLFNPNYAGLRLLDYGFIPPLGTSLNWTVFVLTLHVVWSISSCIAIVEGLAGSRYATPWLGRVGLPLTVILYLLGCVATASFSLKTYPFKASPREFAAVSVVLVAVVVAAFGFFRDGTPRADGQPPSPWVIGTTCLVLSSGFYLLYGNGGASGLQPVVMLAAMLALEGTAIVLLTLWSRRSGWAPVHVLGAATGAIVTYGWLGTSRIASGSTNLGVPTTGFDVIGQVILLLLVLVLIGTAARRLAYK